MDKEKEKQEISLIGRLFCVEALLLLMGIVSLVSGIITGQEVQLFWGVMIIGGSITLYFVRKKDWKKHWEEKEAMQRIYEQQMKEKRERKDGKEK
ncbi:MAG TPA: hypothetical protein VES58_07535 [Syntrophobacteria bacterium]|nr:hypothetical protein [Syntrophobacteria bacterium]